MGGGGSLSLGLYDGKRDPYLPGLVLVAAEPYGSGRACGAPRSAVHHNRRRGVPDCFGGIRTLASHVFSAFPDVIIR